MEPYTYVPWMCEEIREHFRFSLSTMWGLRNWTQVVRFGSKCWAILLALGLYFECTALNHTVKISTTFLLSPHRWLSLCSAEGMTLRCSRWFSVLPVFSVRVGGGTSSSPYSKWILYHGVISSTPFGFTRTYLRIINWNLQRQEINFMSMKREKNRWCLDQFFLDSRA